MMWALLTLILLCPEVYSKTNTRYTNVDCEVLDPATVVYKECRLYVLGRGVIGLNIHAILLKGPLTNAKINLSVWRKYNGFQPFLYNVTFDFCKLMEKPANKKTFQSMFFEALADSTNINHSCPFEKAIIVKNMVFQEKYLQHLPIPAGVYKFQLIGATNNSWKTKISFTVKHEEDPMNT